MIIDDSVEQIKNRIRLSLLISRYIRVEEKGRKKVALCPFHDDHNPSLSIDDERGNYKCWSCGASGDVFSFVMHMEKIDFKTALVKLADECGIKLKNKNFSKGLHEKKENFYKIYSILTDEFKKILYSSESESVEALAYLRARGLNDDVIDEFNIGYSPNNKNFIYNFLSKKGFSDDDIYSSGLYSQSLWPYFADGRIMLPITNEDSKIVAFSARTLKKDKSVAKYINSSESLIFKKSCNFFALSQSLPFIRKKNSPVICEGNFDAIALHRAGIKTALASCGTAFTPDHANILKRFSSYFDNTVHIFPDNDSAGIKASFQWIDRLVSSGLKVKVIKIDENLKDADEAINAKGEQYLKECFDKSIEDVEYIYNIISSSKNKDSIHFASDVASELKWYYEALGNDLDRNSFLDFLSKKINVEKKIIKSDLLTHDENKYELYRINNIEGKDGYDFDMLSSQPFYEMDLINVILPKREYFDAQIMENISYNDFRCKKARILYSLLSNMSEEEEKNDELFIKSIDDEKIRQYVENIISTKSKDYDEKSYIILEESIDSMIKTRKRHEIEQLKAFGSESDKINSIIFTKMIEYNKKNN